MIDVSDALDDYMVLKKLKIVETVTVDFNPALTVQVFDMPAVVQPADLDELKPDTIDWSREYIKVHSRVQMALDNYIEHDGGDYKIVKIGKFSAYGYYKAIAEETKKTVLLASPTNLTLAITGMFTVGHLLTLASTWTGATSFTYQWIRDNVPIAGATAATYMLAAPDGTHTVGCIVTAKNATSQTIVTAPGQAVAP